MASATEAELGAMYINAKEAIPIRKTLQELGHPQPPTPIITDNAVAHGIINRTVKQQKSKAMDMRYYWIQDRSDQGQVDVGWKPGKINLGDYYTKHHSAKHHQAVRPIYLHTQASN